MQNFEPLFASFGDHYTTNSYNIILESSLDELCKLWYKYKISNTVFLEWNIFKTQTHDFLCFVIIVLQICLEL